MASSIAARWVSFDPISQSITSFLEDWKPSSTLASEVEWICVSRLKASKFLYHGTPALMCAWEALCASKKDDVNCVDLQTLAEKHNVIAGKWLLFVPTKAVDEAWWIIANAVVSGDLGDDAKVSTLDDDLLHLSEKPPDGKLKFPTDACHKAKSKKVKSSFPVAPPHSHVICVYAKNFNDVEEVFKVREKLDGLGFKEKLSFKPDAYSFCGVYSGNRWGVEAMDVNSMEPLPKSRLKLCKRQPSHRHTAKPKEPMQISDSAQPSASSHTPPPVQQQQTPQASAVGNVANSGSPIAPFHVMDPTQCGAFFKEMEDKYAWVDEIVNESKKRKLGSPVKLVGDHEGAQWFQVGDAWKDDGKRNPGNASCEAWKLAKATPSYLEKFFPSLSGKGIEYPSSSSDSDDQSPYASDGSHGSTDSMGHFQGF